MSKKPKELPYFLKVKGCINCHVHTLHKNKYGYDYGCFDHELMAGCVMSGCENYGHTICKPFMHPDEVRRMAKTYNNKEITCKAEVAAVNIETALTKEFGEGWDE
jgi:hypothetical protein